MAQQHIEDRTLIRELLDPAYFAGYAPPRLTVVDHHVASAFYPSGFAAAVVLVADGSGDGTSTSTFHGTTAGLTGIDRYPYTQSLGWFYETVAEHLGLGDWTSTGKLMGLASLGPARWQGALDLQYRVAAGGPGGAIVTGRRRHGRVFPCFGNPVEELNPSTRSVRGSVEAPAGERTRRSRRADIERVKSSFGRRRYVRLGLGASGVLIRPHDGRVHRVDPPDVVDRVGLDR